jgi:hypothetical protein
MKIYFFYHIFYVRCTVDKLILFVIAETSFGVSLAVHLEFTNSQEKIIEISLMYGIIKGSGEDDL